MQQLLLIGDSGVGKSSLLTRFADETYSDSYISTIGVDFKIRTVDIDNRVCKLQIWDTAGQERFRTITNSYYRGAHGIIVVYDCTSADSFAHVDTWLSEIEKCAVPGVKVLIVGNKCDLALRRQVEYETARQFADARGVPLLEASAKTGANADSVFVQVAAAARQQLAQRRLQTAGGAGEEGLGGGGAQSKHAKLNSSKSLLESSRVGCCWQ